MNFLAYELNIKWIIVIKQIDHKINVNTSLFIFIMQFFLKVKNRLISHSLQLKCVKIYLSLCAFENRLLYFYYFANKLLYGLTLFKTCHEASFGNRKIRGVWRSSSLSQSRRGWAFALHAEDWSTIPGGDRPKSLKQVMTDSLSNAWQQVWVLRVLGDDHYEGWPVSQ